MNQKCIKKMNKQKGMSLLEVLIAALILGVALVSIAITQINALKVSSNSSYRTTATDIARTLAGRMRVNVKGVVGDDFNSDIKDATDNYYLTDWTATDDGCGAAAPQRCSTNVAGDAVDGHADDDDYGGCTAKEMAAWDIYETTCAPGIGIGDSAVNALLPGGELNVACDFTVLRTGSVNLSADNCTIRIRWDDSGLMAEDGTLLGDVGSEGKQTLEFNVMPGTFRDLRAGRDLAF